MWGIACWYQPRLPFGQTASAIPIRRSGPADALRSLITALREAGAGPQHVVRTRAYITDAAIGEDVAEAHAEVFRTVLRASSIIVVSGFL